MKFEDYFATPSRDKIIRQLAQSDLCPNEKLIMDCGFYDTCNKCWEHALNKEALKEIETKN